MPALFPLTAHLVGWAAGFPEPLGYVHHGRAYVTGCVTNPRAMSLEAPAAGSTLMTGMPAEMRPPAPRAVILPIISSQTDDVCNTSLNLPFLWATTVHPDGSWTFDEALPASINAPPPEEPWFYEGGTVYSPPAEGEEVHRYPQYKLALRLTLALGNAHWDVSPTADEPMMTSLAPYITAAFTDAAATYAVHGNRVHLGGGVKANEDDAATVFTGAPAVTTAGLARGTDWTTALLDHEPDPPTPLALRVNHVGELSVDQDLIVPAADTPPLRGFLPFPGRSARGEAESKGIEGEGPAAAAGPGQLALSVTNTGGVLSCELQGCHLVKGVLQCVGSGFSTDCGIELEGEEATIKLALDIHRLLAMCHPAPDWYTISFDADCGSLEVASETGKFHDECHTFICGKGNCIAGCLGFFGGTAVTISGAGFSAEDEVEGGNAAAFIGGGLLPAPEALYKGSPHITGLEVKDLWTPAQATTITVTASVTGAHIFNAKANIWITPYYERRQLGLHAGDALDLSKTGWEVAALQIGPHGEGMVKLPVGAPRAGGGGTATSRAGVVVNGGESVR